MASITYYKGFAIRTNNIDQMDQLKKTVDDYEDETRQKPLGVDAARIDMARITAYKMLTPMSAGQSAFIARMMNRGATVVRVMRPTRIEARHITKSSRVRGFVHGGMLGLLSVRFMNDSSQAKGRSSTYHSMSVIERVNNETGCTHVRWSIPEFQYRFNMNVELPVTRNENPFAGLTMHVAISRLEMLNTDHQRNQFLAECAAYANEITHSRIVAPIQHVIGNRWISEFMIGFSKVCAFKMSQVNDQTISKIERCMNLVDLYHFLAANIGWILNDPLIQCITNMSRLYMRYIERLLYMAKDGIEHSAYMMATHFPELMSPELHVRVIPVSGVYRNPELQIAEDDALFGPLKAAYQRLMPDYCMG